MHFAKLKYKHSFPIPTNIQVIEGVTYKWYGEHAEYALYQGDPIVEEQLKNILPKKYQKYFKGSLAVLSNDVILPHVDEGKVTINFYIQTANATTSFYHVKNPTNSEKIFQNTNAKLWNHNEVEYIDSFTASPGEIWILDTQVPHGVKCTTKEHRIAYALRTDYLNFSAVRHIFQESMIADDTVPFEDMPI